MVTRPDIVRVAAWGSAAALLLIPLIAMCFTDEVVWTRTDFAVAAILIALLGGAIELALRRLRSVRARTAGVIAALATFLFVWGALATA